ncbi:MAG: dihydroneopterin aldolase [Saprospiraceae bacterium]|nr:dihydroneopterin aldolase [Saprospiraceae bacterium]
MSIVAIEGMRFYAYHGFYPEEQAIGGEYLVDVYVDVDFSGAASADDLDGTVNYETIYRVAKIVMSQPVKLIETIAQKIIDRLKVVLSAMQAIRVRIVKLNPPLGASVQRAYIELEDDFVVKCGKCGRAFLSHEPGDCWTKYGTVYPETKATLMRAHGRNICVNCLSPYFIKSRDKLLG